MRAISVNRIFTFAIVSSLICLGGDVAGQKAARMPRSQRQTDDITYTHERASVMPSYQGYYRKPSIETTPSATAALGRSSRYREPGRTSEIKSLTPAQSREAAPVISGRLRRFIKPEQGRSVVEVPAPAQHEHQTAQRGTEVVETSTFDNASPVRQPETIEAAPMIPGSSRRITKTEVTVPSPVINRSSRRITAIAAAAPVINRAARYIAKSKEKIQSAERAPMSALPSSGQDTPVPDANDSTEPQIEVAQTKTPVQASTNIDFLMLKDRIRYGYGPEDFQQSQWEARPRSAAGTEKVTVSSPDQGPTLDPLDSIDVLDVFDVDDPLSSKEDVAVATVSNAAQIDSAPGKSPFVSATSETSSASAVEIENAVIATARPTASLNARALPEAASQAVVNSGQIMSPETVSGPSSRFKFPANKRAHTFADREEGRQKMAAGPWALFLSLSVVPLLALVVWMLSGRKKRREYQKVPSIEIPEQSCNSWQQSQDTDLSDPVADKAPSRGFGFPREMPEELSSETEVLDEINSISSIAASSNSEAASTLKPRDKKRTETEN